jgi:tetratricopeptide (TPR) repeat protein
LGILYDRMGRMEEAATFYRQSAENYTRSENQAREGQARHNLARTLIRLRRYDDARQELQRAIECKEPYGHAAEPWKTWANLEDLERKHSRPRLDDGLRTARGRL